MTDKRGYFDHYQRNGMWVQRKLTTTPVADRITRKARPSKNLPIGAWVRVRNSRNILGQVWAQGYRSMPGYWWIADGEKYLFRHEGTLEVVGLASDDLELDLSA